MQRPFDHRISSTSTTPPHLPDPDPESYPRWASRLLLDCATAIADKDSATSHHLLWALNELSSPYGDLNQRLASHFLQALFCRATASGRKCHRNLSLTAERSRSFDAARKVMLRFQELSPFLTFGHVASNAAILDAIHSHAKIHIVDIGDTYCTQWPTLLEALATRADDPPTVRLTVVVVAPASTDVIREVGQRMQRFAKLMGVPLKFEVVGGLTRLSELTESHLRLAEDEALVVSCSGALRRIDPSRRDSFLRMLSSMSPRVVTVVEEDADFTHTAEDFLNCFKECLRFYTLVFEMLQESLGATSNERLALERECSRSIVGVLAIDGEGGGTDEEGGDSERRERGRQWRRRLSKVLSPVSMAGDTAGDVVALLKRYRGDWSVKEEDEEGQGLYLRWKEESLVWASAWRS